MIDMQKYMKTNHYDKFGFDLLSQSGEKPGVNNKKLPLQQIRPCFSKYHFEKLEILLANTGQAMFQHIPFEKRI